MKSINQQLSHRLITLSLFQILWVAHCHKKLLINRISHLEIRLQLLLTEATYWSKLSMRPWWLLLTKYSWKRRLRILRKSSRPHESSQCMPLWGYSTWEEEVRFRSLNSKMSLLSFSRHAQTHTFSTPKFIKFSVAMTRIQMASLTFKNFLTYWFLKPTREQQV